MSKTRHYFLPRSKDGDEEEKNEERDGSGGIQVDGDNVSPTSSDHHSL
jgi:hypothetical protein